jgi:hypothetical protein
MTLAVEVIPPTRLGRGCAGKVRYRSIEAAQHDLLRLCEDIAAGRVTEKYPGNPRSLSVYDCLDGCGFYHVGHRPKRLARA